MGESRGNSRFVVYLLLLVCLEILVTWSRPQADPHPGYGNLETASVHGLELLQLPSEADLPVFVSAPLHLIYETYGRSLPTSRGLSALGSLALLVGLAFFLRKRAGTAVALVAGLFLVSHPAWHAIVRAPGFWPWASFWMGATLWLGTRRSWWSWSTAVVLLVAGALELHPIVLLVAPGLLWGLTQLSGRPVFRVALGVVGIGAIFAVIPDLAARWHAGWQPWEQTQSFFAAFPFLIVVAWLGFLLRLTHKFPPARAGTLVWGCHATLWFGVAVLVPLGDRAFGWLGTLFPILLVCAADTWRVLRAYESRQGRELWNPRGAFALVVFLGGTIGLLGELKWTVYASVLPASLAGVVATGLYILAVAVVPAPRDLRSRAVLPLAVLVFAIPTVPRLVDILSYDGTTLARGNAQLEGLLLPTAKLAGPYAHALTFENSLHAEPVPAEPQQLRTFVLDSGVTHLAVAHPRGDNTTARQFHGVGLPLELIEVLTVMGKPVHLYRVHGPPGRRSAFEDGRLAMRLGDYPQAEYYFLMVGNNHPGTAPAWARLGESVLSRKDSKRAREFLVGAFHPQPSVLVSRLIAAGLLQQRARFSREFAFECYQQAVEADPRRVDARLALYHYYQKQGFEREARHHLEAALEAEPTHPQVKRLAAALD